MSMSRARFVVLLGAALALAPMSVANAGTGTPNLTALCAKVNCASAVSLASPPAPTPCKPKIVKIIGDPPLEPGDEVIVLGSCFGKSGRLRLEGTGVNLSLTTIHWDADYVDATVPAVAGVADDPGAKLRLALPGFTYDVSQPGFRAARDLRPLLPGDVQVACLQSGTDANACQFFDAVTIPGMNTAGATFSGYHAGDNGAPDNIDSIAVALAPGWQINHCSFYTYEEVSDGDPFVIPAFKGCTQGVKSSLLTVDYDLGIVEVLGYKGRVYVTGPKGTPYK